MSPFLNFQRMGLLSPSLIAAHMTTLSPDEIALCGVEKVNIAHCPTSNLKLASGFQQQKKVVTRLLADQEELAAAVPPRPKAAL